MLRERLVHVAQRAPVALGDLARVAARPRVGLAALLEPDQEAVLHLRELGLDVALRVALLLARRAARRPPRRC